MIKTREFRIDPIKIGAIFAALAFVIYWVLTFNGIIPSLGFCIGPLIAGLLSTVAYFAGSIVAMVFNWIMSKLS